MEASSKAAMPQMILPTATTLPLVVPAAAPATTPMPGGMPLPPSVGTSPAEMDGALDPGGGILSKATAGIPPPPTFSPAGPPAAPPAAPPLSDVGTAGQEPLKFKAGPSMPSTSPPGGTSDNSLSGPLDIGTLPAPLALTSPVSTTDVSALSLTPPGPLTGPMDGLLEGCPLASSMNGPVDGAVLEPFTMPAITPAIAPAMLPEAAAPAPGQGQQPAPLLAVNGLSPGTMPAHLPGTAPALSLEQVMPQAKRLKSSNSGDNAPSDEAPAALLAALAPTPPLAAHAEDTSWQEPWANVFMKLQESELEGRAGEYAEALVALRKQAETLKRQRETVKYSCEQLWRTAEREALQAHLKTMMETAEAGVPKEIIEAARRSADEPVVIEPPPPIPGLSGLILDPGLLAKLDPAVVAKLAEAKVPLSGFDPNMQMASSESKVPSKPRKSGWDLGPFAGTAPPAPAPVPMPPAAPGPPGPSPLDGMSSTDAVKFANSLDGGHSNLYVSGLPEGIDETSFRLLFSRHGVIISTKVMPDRKYGFVKFGRKDEAQRAMDSLNGFMFNGTQLSVRFADRDRGQAHPGNKGIGDRKSVV